MNVRLDPTPTSPAVEISNERTRYNNGSKPAEKTTFSVDLVPAIEIEGWPVGGVHSLKFSWVEDSTWEKVTKRFRAVAKIHHTG